tara:strand:- start:1 stop:543 length:543 start_codon:yes stop_codon:yes gene_type:complete
MSTPEIITVNSEALEAQVRDLLPSQNGFGSELQASNVIMPVIDLTATAEGSGLDVSLQQSFAHGSITSFDVNNTTSTLVTNTGFFRVFGAVGLLSNSGSAREGDFSITDGSTSKKIIEFGGNILTSGIGLNYEYDFIVFLRAGDSLTCSSNATTIELKGCTRQIATVTGELVNPSGFVAE